MPACSTRARYYLMYGMRGISADLRHNLYVRNWISPMNVTQKRPVLRKSNECYSEGVSTPGRVERACRASRI